MAYRYPARIRGCTAPQHGLTPSGANSTTEQQLATFVKRAELAGISIQFFVGANKYWVDQLVPCTEASLSYVKRERLYPSPPV